MGAIKTKEELITLLGRGYWIETQFEETAEWNAYVSSLSEKGREVIFILASDSARHKITLEEIGIKLGTDLKNVIDKFDKRIFDFSKMKEDEIFKVILEHEIIARDLYSRLYEFVDREIFRDSKLSADEFFNAMKMLIEDEEKHIKLVEPLSDKTVRIL